MEEMERVERKEIERDSKSAGFIYFTQREDWINSVKLKLQNPQCELPVIIDDIIVFDNAEKGSSSSTIIISGVLKEDNLFLVSDIIMKIRFEEFSPMDNGLSIENKIYKYIINDMIANRITPNLIAYLGDYSCERIRFEDDGYLDTKYYNEAYRISKSKKYNIDNSSIIWLEKSNGVIMQELMSILNEDNDKDQYKEELWNCISSILFQMLYTLSCFNRLGLNHNDLHFGNIFVEKLDEPISLYFNLDGRIIELTTKFIVKIYDWNRGSSLDIRIGRNNSLDNDLCTEYETCNFFNEKYDFYSFMYQFWAIVVSKLSDMKLNGEYNDMKGFYLKVCKIDRIKERKLCHQKYNNILLVKK